MAISPQMQDDISTQTPDEIFTKYTIVEIKGFLDRLKADADAKQEELRLMVGERYRELLHTSSSIISMADSSRHVVSVFEDMRKRLIIEGPISGQAKQAAQSAANDQHLLTFQSLAAHIRLLLDSSEHLWRLLERKQYLSAAWLFLLSRVVYRSLVREEAEEDDLQWELQGIDILGQFPIVQRQWDNISQFRSHIVQKATVSLSDVSLTSEEVCSSLMALYFLDSLPLLDALEVLLSQRLRVLKILAGSISDPQRLDTVIKSYSVTNDSQSSKSKGKIKEILRSIHTILDIISRTLDSSRVIFGEASSMSRKVLLFIQTDESASAEELPGNLQMTTKSILSSFPSSSYFLVLPQNIIEYKPSVDLESKSTMVPEVLIREKLKAWFIRSAELLKTLEDSWLQNLSTIKDVWEIKVHVSDWLSETIALQADEKSHLQNFNDTLCEKRVTEIWKHSLDQMETSFRAALSSLIREIAGSQSERDIDAFYVLSAPPMPSLLRPTSSITPVTDLIQSYTKDIKLKLDGRTPLLDGFLRTFEDKFSNLKNDMSILYLDGGSRNNTVDAYTSDADSTVLKLMDDMENLLDTDEVELSDTSVKKNIFVGHVAEKLSLSSFIGDLGCGVPVAEEFIRRALFLRDRTVERWQRHVIAQALSDYRHEICDTENVHTKPSAALMKALFQIVTSKQMYNITDGGVRDDGLRSSLMQEFTETFCRLIQSNKDGDICIRLFIDLKYIEAFARISHMDWSMSKGVIKETMSDMRQSLENNITAQKISDIEHEIDSNANQFVLQIQHIFQPLLLHHSAPKGLGANRMVNGKGSASARSISGAGEQEFEPVFELVHPSARFGLILVGNTTTR